MNPALDGVTAATVAPAEFVDVMRTLASGVVLVTCRVADRPWAMTVTAFASVSASVPTVLVSLGSRTAGARAIGATGAFGVSILASDQVPLAALGAARGGAKFIDRLVVPEERESASPPIADALAHLDCEVSDAVEAADHIVFFGRVAGARRRGDGEPLVYHDRVYRAVRRTATSNRGNLRWFTS